MKTKLLVIMLVLAVLASCKKPESSNDEPGPDLQDNPTAVDDEDIIKDPGFSVKSTILDESDFPSSEELCNSVNYDLIAGQTIDAGDVVIGNYKDSLYISVYSKDGFQQVDDNIKIWVGSSMPFDKRPPAGQFPNKFTVESGENILHIRFSIAELGITCSGPEVFLIIHADVLASGEEGSQASAETAFAGVPGTMEEGDAWWYHISYTPKCCEEITCTVTATASVTNVLCTGATNGAVDLTVAGGTAPYTYLWSNGSTDEDLANIAAGSYTVTVTDTKGCKAEASAAVNEPVSAISASKSITDATIFGAADGAVELTVTGGTGLLTYLWSNGAKTEDIDGLTAGTYSVIITDLNGCTITVNDIVIGQPDEIIPPIIPTGEVAFGQKSYAPKSYCFSKLDFDNNGTPDFTSWGWTNGPIPLDLGSYFNLFIGAADCNTANAVNVGRVDISYSNGVTLVTFSMKEGYTMNETRLYIGNEKLPRDNNGNFTVDPKFYPYKHENLNGVTKDTFTIEGPLSDNIYVVLYSLINR